MESKGSKEELEMAALVLCKNLGLIENSITKTALNGKIFINTCNEVGENHCLQAPADGHTQLIYFLLMAGSNIEAANTHLLSTSIIWVASGGKLE